MVIILQPSLVEYRIHFYDDVNNLLPMKFTLVAGDRTFMTGVSASKPIERDWLQLTTNHFLIAHLFVWQRGVVLPMIQCPIAVVNINPRYLSTWLILALRALLGRPTIAWGHLYSTKGNNSYTNFLRFLQYSFCKGIALYTDYEVDSAPAWMRDRKITIGLQNSNVRKLHCYARNSNTKPIDFIYVGRFEPEKKFYRLVEAFTEVSHEISPARLILVGGGSEEARVRSVYNQLVEEGRIVFAGWIWDADALGELYARAAFAVSPGYVGLNVIQSFAHGVPMIVSRDEPHSPEIAVCREGDNTVYFEEKGESDLKNVLLKAFTSRDKWLVKRPIIANDIRENWTVEEMAKRFAHLIERVDACS